LSFRSAAEESASAFAFVWSPFIILSEVWRGFLRQTQSKDPEQASSILDSSPFSTHTPPESADEAGVTKRASTASIGLTYLL
jgi:hypothetical protein